MEYIREGLASLSNKLVGSVMSQGEMDLATTENEERAYRMDDSKIVHDQAHGRDESSLISDEAGYVILSSPSQAAHRYFRTVEETERRRRIASSPEVLLRRRNAHRAAAIVASLGWPFINYEEMGSLCIRIHPTSLACEDERDARLKDDMRSRVSRDNAALVSNLVRWAFTDAYKNLHGGLLHRPVHTVEEKERSRRLADRSGMATASLNAYLVSRMIKTLGWPFYVQERTSLKTGEGVKETSSLSSDDVSSPVQKSLSVRLRDLTLATASSVLGAAQGAADSAIHVATGAAETALHVAQDAAGTAILTAQNVAGTIGRGVSNVRTSTLNTASAALEAAEGVPAAAKKGAMNAFNTAGNIASDAIYAVTDWSVQDHMHVVASMTPAKASLTLQEMEDKERRHRMRYASQVREHAHQECSVIHEFFSTRPLAQYLYDTERARRIKDKQGQDTARENAAKVVSMMHDYLLAQKSTTEESDYRDRTFAPSKIVHSFQTSSPCLPHKVRKEVRETSCDAAFLAHHAVLQAPSPANIVVGNNHHLDNGLAARLPPGGLKLAIPGNGGPAAPLLEGKIHSDPAYQLVMPGNPSM